MGKNAARRFRRHALGNARAAKDVGESMQKQTLLLAVLLTLFTISLAAGTLFAGSDAPTRFEAENAALENVTVSTEATGFSGRGYVTGLTADGSRLTFRVPAPSAGAYALTLIYRSASGEKGYALKVNGRSLSGMLPKSATFAAASVGRTVLKAGENVIVVEKGWGYYDVDALEVAVAPPPAKLKPVPATPADKKADPAAHALLKRLNASYGKTTLTGQHGLGDNEYVQTKTGGYPDICSDDLIDFSPTRREHGTDPKDLIEKIIARHQAGQIISLCWHWNAPKDLIDKKITGADGRERDLSWYRGFYTDSTTFDVEKALANPDSEDYKLLLRDMDVIAEQLKKLQEAGVPVLWRPLHEAEGGWFWWGAKGPEPCKKLYRLMFDRFTNKHQLHNLIWVWSSGVKPEWYPGDDVVDIVGVDAYPPDPSDPLTSTWDTLLAQHDGRKIIALSEFGKVPDRAGMKILGVRFAYFVSWSGDLGAKGVPDDELRKLYR